MRVWIDDERPMPEGYDVSLSNAEEAIGLLSLNIVSFISLDHDLGDSTNGTGYDIAEWIEMAAYFNKIKPLKWKIHSMNSVGAVRIRMALENADKFWKNHGVKI